MPSSPPFLALLSRWNLGGYSWDNLIGDRHWPYCSCYPSSFVELCHIGSVCCWGYGYWRRSIAVVVGLDAAVLWLKNCSLMTEALDDWSSCFKLAMGFLASTSLFSSVFMASHFVWTRLASSSTSFAASSYSFFFSSDCCPRSFVSFSWFRKACASLSWSFSKLSYRFWSSLLLRSESVSRASAFRWRLIGGWQFHICTDCSRHHSFCK